MNECLGGSLEDPYPHTAVTKTFQPEAWHLAQSFLRTGLALVLARGARWLFAPERPVLEDLLTLALVLTAFWAWSYARRGRFALVFDDLHVEGPTDAGRRHRFLIQEFERSEPKKSYWPAAIYLTTHYGQRLYLRTNWLSPKQVTEASALLVPYEPERKR